MEQLFYNQLIYRLKGWKIKEPKQLQLTQPQGPGILLAARIWFDKSNVTFQSESSGIIIEEKPWHLVLSWIDRDASKQIRECTRSGAPARNILIIEIQIDFKWQMWCN